MMRLRDLFYIGPVSATVILLSVTAVLAAFLFLLLAGWRP